MHTYICVCMVFWRVPGSRHGFSSPERSHAPHSSERERLCNSWHEELAWHHNQKRFDFTPFKTLLMRAGGSLRVTEQRARFWPGGCLEETVSGRQSAP